VFKIEANHVLMRTCIYSIVYIVISLGCSVHE